MGKNFISLKEGDKLYCISMIDSDIQEIKNHCMQEKTVTGIIRTADMSRIMIRLQGGDAIYTNTDSSYHVRNTKPEDEINLSFDIYSTSKETCVEEAQRLVYEKLKVLDIIRKRVSESETGLLLAGSALELIDTKEEELTEEFASMALC